MLREKAKLERCLAVVDAALHIYTIGLVREAPPPAFAGAGPMAAGPISPPPAAIVTGSKPPIKPPAPSGQRVPPPKRLDVIRQVAAAIPKGRATAAPPEGIPAIL
jgi:hypothetical protein